MNAFNPSEVAALLSSEFCVRLTQSLLHFLWQGVAVGLAVWILDRALRRASSQWRYAVGVTALLAMLACVPATYFVLGNTQQHIPSVAAPAIPAADQSAAAVDGNTAALPVAANAFLLRTVEEVTVPDQPVAWTWRSLLSIPIWLAPYATGAYLLGVACMLARLGMALWSGHQLRQSALPLADPAILTMVARQARRVGLKIAPAVAWCQRAAVPLVVGIARPIILLPPAIASGLAPDQLEALLAHELAHLRRLDLVVNLVQRLAESLLFFHPAVWYVSRQISIERENCCDDCVLRAGWGRVEYADALVRMAEVCAAVRGLAGVEGAALLAASGEGPSQFKRRVLRLLDAQDHLRVGISRGWLLAAVGSLLLAVVALPLASQRKPQALAEQTTATPDREEPILTPRPKEPAAKRSTPERKAKRFFRGKDALDRIDEVHPAWSETQEGVQFGVALISDKTKFRSGERVPLEIFVRSAGKDGVEVTLSAEFLGNVPELKSAAEEAIPVERILLTGSVPLYREFLKPGQAFGFRHPGVGLGPNPAPGKQNWHPFLAEPKPGKYTLRHTHDLDVDPENGLIPGKRVRFTSGALQFEVVDGAVGDRPQSRDDATRTLQVALLDRRKYLEGTFPDEERLIKSELFVAEQKRTKAQESLDSTKRLAAKGFITPLQLEAAEAGLRQAQIYVDNAQAKLGVLRKFTKEKTVAELDRKVAQAIDALLDQRVALKVTDRPLIFVLDDLEKAYKIPVTIDLKEVHSRGLSEQTRVTIDVVDKPLREVFQAVLISAGLDFEVTADGIHVPAKAKPAGRGAKGAAIPEPFKPFECQIVDAVTGKPINDVTVSFLYKTIAAKDKPEETVANLIYTNVGISRFWFLIPDQAIGRPDLLIQWGAGHPAYEPLSPKERIPLAHILADDPKSARDTFRVIKLQPKKTDAPPVPVKGSQARIRVKYDIAGAEDDGQIFVQHIGGRDIIGTRDDGHLKTNPVKKGETLEIGNLDPGDYQVARHRMIRLGELGMSRFLDRQRFKLKTDETKTIDFTRPTGQPVNGTVLGLKEAGLTTAIVNVCSENAKDDRSIGDLEVTVFDARLCAADGTFKTEQLAPGRYMIVVEGYVPLTPEQRVQTGFIRPSYLAITAVTVPEKGEAPKVELNLEDAEKIRAAKAGARLQIHYDIPGAEERGRFVVEGPGAAAPEQAWGDLTVQLVYDGPKPELKKLPVPRDIGTFGAEALDESLLVGDKGGLANVAVYLTSAGIPIHPEARRRAEKPAELKVTGAGTRPRILPMMVPQTLKLINNTTVGANFKWDGQANSPFNVLVAREDSRELTLTKAERAPSPVSDGIHPWLIAFLLPLDHPYASISGTDGTARLTNLPEGEWTFRFWHEKAGYLKSADGQREFKIKIEPGKSRLRLRVSPKFVAQADDGDGNGAPR